ncbi:hypothetical protein [Arthrobacter sp. AL12]|uniref:hypothetical protein n=1 Tax=Arthrobacter sp. AL12 TaxID=3042241 RepID=UPI00249CB381|nr:hypothetical protein [Arthrobacter sp. AL12]MDI3212066.1 hypothetical protein [Arthrobacter sp. AL12]
MAVPLRTGWRSVVLAGGFVVALSGAGAAAVWAGTEQSATPLATPTTSAAQPPGTSPAEGRAPQKNRDLPLHGENVVKKSDGGFETRLTQQGAIEAVSSVSITVRSEDGFSQTYVLNAGTEITKLPPPAADGTVPRGNADKRLKPTDAAAADLKTGEQVRIKGVKDESGITAGHIIAGAPGLPGKGPGNGVGKGLGKGLGKHLGNGHWKDKAVGQAP